MPLKKYLLAFILLEILFSYSPALAQTPGDSSDYRNSGVEKQIGDYLCVPSKVQSDQRTDNGNYTDRGTQQQYAASNNTNNQDLYKCINKLYKFAIVLASVAGVFFIVIAGYVYMSSDGDAEAVTKAKGLVTSTVVSLIILLSGYVLLRAINPDLIQFHSIQPPSVTLDTSNYQGNQVGGGGNASTTPLNIRGGAGAANEILSSGCTFQNPKQENEAQYMTPALLSKVKILCSQASSLGSGKPAISSIIGEGQHAANSYHYKGCAVDFADKQGNGYFDFATKNGRPIGKAVYNAAIQAGFSQDRINPGSDRSQTYHIHLDLGNSCAPK